MNILTKLFSAGASEIVSSVGDAVDKLVTSDEERLALKNRLKEIETNAALRAKELDNALEGEITNRWESDNASGSWLSKNVRPASLVYLLGVLTVLAFADGNVGTFSIKPAYVSLFETLAVAAFSGYFVIRGLEKIKGVAK